MGKSYVDRDKDIGKTKADILIAWEKGTLWEKKNNKKYIRIFFKKSQQFLAI